MSGARIQATAAALFAAAVALHTIVTPDLWWHLAAGRWIVENGAVPRTDVLSYTMTGHDWINLQWLTDVALFLLWSWAGPGGVVLAKAACFATVAVLLVFAARAAGAGSAAAGLTALLAVAASAERTLVRPEVLTALLFTALLLVLARVRAGWRAGMFVAPVLVVVWANVHALAFLGPLTILWYGILEIVDARLPARWRDGPPASGGAGRGLLLSGAVASAALLLNPYGAHAWSFPFVLFRRIDGNVEVFSHILEFERLLDDPGDPVLRFTWLLLALLVGTFLAILPRLPLTRLARVVPYLILALLARRNVSLFAIAAAGVVAVNLTEAGHRVLSGRGRRAAGWVPPLLGVAGAAAILSGASSGLLGLYRDRGLAVAPDIFPEECLTTLDSSGVDGNLFHDLDFGGYIAWRDPGRKTFIDGRLEVAGADWFSRYVEVHRNPRAWERMRSSWNLEALLLQHYSPGSAAFLRGLLESGGWSATCYSPEAVLLVFRERGTSVAPAAKPGGEDWDRILGRDRGPAPRAGTGLGFLTEPLHRAIAPALPGRSIRRAVRYANLCLTLGWTGAAREGYERVLAAAPHDAECLFQLGVCDVREGRIEEARRRWEKGLAIVGREDRPLFRDALERLDSTGP